MVKSKEKMVRKNVYCTAKNVANLKKYSEELSISESSFINLCISEYAKQQEALAVMNGMQELLQEVKSLNATIASQKDKSQG